jgi:hypothetical protein
MSNEFKNSPKTVEGCKMTVPTHHRKKEQIFD